MTEREKFVDKWIAGRKSRKATMAELNTDLDKVIKSENVSIQDKIKKLIPFVSENFITFPLAEEGNLTPFINFWKIVETWNEAEMFNRKLHDGLFETGYEYGCEVIIGRIHSYNIHPAFVITGQGGYEYVNPNWSIEGMLDIIGDVIGGEKQR